MLTTYSLEPLIPEDRKRELEDLATELVDRASRLAGRVHPVLQEGLGDLVRADQSWRDGMTTLCERESSFRPNAINLKDKNATGPAAPDGHPQNCSRGIAQCIPSTFAKYHAEGASWEIYDPVANLAASINYAVRHYHVSEDGSDLAQKVQQANSSRDAHGYMYSEEI